MTNIEAACKWLEDYLAKRGGRLLSSKIKEDGAAAGHNAATLKRARQKLKLQLLDEGFPRRTYWALPDWEEPKPEPEVPISQPAQSQPPHVPHVRLSGADWGRHARQRVQKKTWVSRNRVVRVKTWF